MRWLFRRIIVEVYYRSVVGTIPLLLLQVKKCVLCEDTYWHPMQNVDTWSGYLQIIVKQKYRK